MAVNERTDDRRRDSYYVGNVAGVPGDGHLWVDSQNANRIQIFRNGSWVTPRFDGITLTGTTTVTTLNATDLTVASALTSNTFRAAGVASLTTIQAVNATVASLLISNTARFTGVASLAGTNVNGTLTSTNETVASTLTTVALKAATGAARADGFIALGTEAVPTTATSTSGFIQIAALPGTPVGQSAVPTTGTAFLTYDTIGRAIAINVAGSWFRVASLALY